MGNQSLVEDLLELIFEKASLNYLSDLHSPLFYESVLNAVSNIPAEQFDDNTWREATMYILMQNNIAAMASSKMKKYLTDSLTSLLSKGTQTIAH